VRHGHSPPSAASIFIFFFPWIIGSYYGAAAMDGSASESPNMMVSLMKLPDVLW
jgi:hypothetical protein